MNTTDFFTIWALVAAITFAAVVTYHIVSKRTQKTQEGRAAPVSRREGWIK
jgi:hypothetical protein